MHGAIAILIQPSKMLLVVLLPTGLVHLGSNIMAEVPSKSPSKFDEILLLTKY